jgi:hypothetical protein
MSETEKDQEKSVGPLQAIASVFAAAFGVQSSKNRERDFKQGRFRNFVIAGVLFTAFFVGTVYLVVTTVLEYAR